MSFLQRLANNNKESANPTESAAPRRRRIEPQVIVEELKEADKTVSERRPETKGSVKVVENKPSPSPSSSIAFKPNQSSHAKVFIDEEEEDDDDEDDEDDDDEEEDFTPKPLHKPVFIPKSQRKTIEERERMEQELLEQEAREKEIAMERKTDSMSLVTRVVKRELEEEANKDLKEVSQVDDSDNIDPEAEYQAWTLRELKRIKRDRLEMEEYRSELEDMERIRNMSDDEKAQYLKEKEEANKAKGKKQSSFTFMQKYYHKGAFFMDSGEEIYKRDFSVPTEQESINKEALPKALQVKNFGKRSRSKWTHLANEDTTEKDAGWAQAFIKKKQKK